MMRHSRSRVGGEKGPIARAATEHPALAARAGTEDGMKTTRRVCRDSIWFMIHGFRWSPVARSRLGVAAGLPLSMRTRSTLWPRPAPLETVAVLRQVLVPVYLERGFSLTLASRCRPTKMPGNGAGRRGRLDGERIDAYLTRFRRPVSSYLAPGRFAQVAGLRTANDETKPVFRSGRLRCCRQQRALVFRPRTEGRSAGN